MDKAISTPNLEKEIEEIRRAASLIKYLDEPPIALPAPVVSEFLSGPHNQSESIRNSLLSKFDIKPFDAYAAYIAANLFKRHYQNIRQDTSTSTPRQCLKVDVMIAGILVAHGITNFYTNDIKDYKRLLENTNVNILGLPRILGQTQLFDDERED